MRACKESCLPSLVVGMKAGFSDDGSCVRLRGADDSAIFDLTRAKGHLPLSLSDRE